MATILREYSLRRYRGRILPTVILFFLVIGAASVCGVDLNLLRKGIGNGIEFLGYLFPPDWSTFPAMLQPVLESILIAFLATVFGTIISLFFGLAAAANVAPKWLRNTSRFLIAAERALPEIIILLLLVAMLGLGPYPGVMALSLGCIGMLGKLFADAIEEVDPVTLESLEAVGANKVQAIFFSILPQVVPSIITNAIFRFEINIRLSVILGAVGAGGIGFELYHSFSLLEYQRAAVAIIVILGMVFLTQRLSDFLRKKINQKGVLP